MSFPRILAAIGCVFAIYVLEETVLGQKENPKLFLTPYIKSGKFEEAKEASIIRWNRESLDGVPSYSGFLTVNETTNSNLFFWFVPAMVEDPEDAPLILWLNGLGTSSMFGLFVENGPFKVKKRGRIPKLVLRVRKDTWARRHSMLYIDSPVGTGFSFTENEDGYAKTQDDIAGNLYTALGQFFTIFSEFSKQDLYLAGESYAGKYVPRLGVKIHEENQKENATKINLKGIITGGPLTDPKSLTNQYSDYFYYLGLIDEQGRAYFKTQEALAAKLFEEGNISESQRVKDELLFSRHLEYPSYFSNQSGFRYFANALETTSHKKRYYYTQFLNLTSTRKLIHVGDQPFNNVSARVSQDLLSDLELSNKEDMERIINLKYKTLIYVGQMDLITPHVAISNFIQSMNFDQKDEYLKAERKIMKDRKRGDVSGYAKSAGNFYFVIVRNAGHHAPSDEPRWCREIIEKFISGTSEESFE